jgi:predicted P-loop ATPase
VPAPNLDIAEGWKQRLILSQNGAPKPILANAITALQHAPEWAGVLAYNEFSMATVALKSPPWGGTSAGTEWSDHEDRRATEWLQHQGILVGVEVSGQAVQVAAKDRTFHPVREYLDGLRWDGIKRIDTWLSLYLGVESSDYAAAVGSCYLIQAVARIYKPGCKADTCPILEGAQGTLKSTAIRIMGGAWYTDEIAELGTKDASLQTLGIWIVELSELDSMSRAEVSRIKSFMSRGTDRFRPPYGRRVITSPRQCVFVGSVNHSTYLKDDTGGRRFWPVACGSIHIDTLTRDRDHLWAEAVTQFKAGAPWWLDTKELNHQAEQEQAARFEADPWQELISEWLNGRDSVSVPEVLIRCIEKPKDKWLHTDENRVARSLRALSWERYRERSGNTLEWRYRRKQA